MTRWLEEWEFLQAHFMWCIRSFHRMQDIWSALGESCASPGPMAYVRKTAVMYSKLAAEAEKKFFTAGYGHRILKEGEILADHVARDRRDSPPNPGVSVSLRVEDTVRPLHIPFTIHVLI